MNIKIAPHSNILVAFCATALALPYLATAAENVSWTWDCESADSISSGNIGGLSCSSLTSLRLATDTSTEISVDSGHIKLVPATGDGGHFATVVLPADVTSYGDAQYDSWTFSFDYAPSKGRNDKDQTNYGLSVHDGTGKALVWFYGYQNSTFSIYKGADDTSSLGTIELGDITQYDAKGATNWFHVVISGSNSTGVTLAITNKADKTEVVLSSNVLSEQMVLPKSVLVRTASYSSPARQQWALLDDFSFTGTTIYKDKFTKSLDCTFDSENDDTSVLTNGFVTSVLLETEEKVNEDANWTVATGAAQPKVAEQFVQISSGHASTQGLLVNMPKAVARAEDYVLEFDAMVMMGYDGQDTNGVAIVGTNGILATLRVPGSADATLYKGDSENDVLADSIACTFYKNNAPISTECIWYHFIVRGDAENGVRLSMRNLATGAAVVENVSLGAYDTVETIALRAFIHGNRTIYAAVDNIVAYTWRKPGFAICIR